MCNQVMKQLFKSRKIVYHAEKRGQRRAGAVLKKLTIMQYFIYSLIAGVLKYDSLSNRHIEDYAKICHQIQSK